MNKKAIWIFNTRTLHGDVYGCSNCGHKHEGTEEDLPDRCIMCGMDMMLFKPNTPTAAAFNILGAMLMENTKPEMIDLPLRAGKKTFGYFEDNQ